MGENVIQIGDFRIAQKQRSWLRSKSECRHLSIELDDNGGLVKCSDCKESLSPYWALSHLAEQFNSAYKKVEARAARVEEDKSANIHLIAARVVEKAWRRKQMVPTCPHCSCGIKPTDNFGHSLIHVSIEDRRRAASKQQERDDGRR